MPWIVNKDDPNTMELHVTCGGDEEIDRRAIGAGPEIWLCHECRNKIAHGTPTQGCGRRFVAVDLDVGKSRREKFMELALSRFAADDNIVQARSYYEIVNITGDKARSRAGYRYALCRECDATAYEGETLHHHKGCIVGLAREIRGLPEVVVPKE